MSTAAPTANHANISICSGNYPNGATKGANEEKYDLPDVERNQKTAAHPRLAVLPKQGHSKRI